MLLPEQIVDACANFSTFYWAHRGDIMLTIPKGSKGDYSEVGGGGISQLWLCMKLVAVIWLSKLLHMLAISFAFLMPRNDQANLLSRPVWPSQLIAACASVCVCSQYYRQLSDSNRYVRTLWCGCYLLQLQGFNGSTGGCDNLMGGFESWGRDWIENEWKINMYCIFIGIHE